MKSPTDSICGLSPDLWTKPDLWTDFSEMKNPLIGGCTVFPFQHARPYHFWPVTDVYFFPIFRPFNYCYEPISVFFTYNFDCSRKFEISSLWSNSYWLNKKLDWFLRTVNVLDIWFKWNSGMKKDSI